jgi:signal transduction histidine kinase
MEALTCPDLPSAPAVASVRPPRNRQGRLLHGYLHKTSNSLCGIKGYASLIASGPARDAQASRWARRILAEVERLEMVYRSVQEMAFPPDRRAGVRGELGAVVARAVAEVRRQHDHLVVAWREDVSANLLLPEHDLEVALVEILRNSAESRPAGGSARVRVRLTCGCGRDGRLILQAADDGPGMSRELVARAADPFVTTKEGHLGIGLARVDTIMDLNGLGWSLQGRPGEGTQVVLEVGRSDDAGRSRLRGKGE